MEPVLQNCAIVTKEILTFYVTVERRNRSTRVVTVNAPEFQYGAQVVTYPCDGLRRLASNYEQFQAETGRVGAPLAETDNKRWYPKYSFDSNHRRFLENTTSSSQNFKVRQLCLLPGYSQNSGVISVK